MAAVPLGDYPAFADAQLRELIERYAPDVLWNDIAWPGDQASFLRLVADYYDALPEGVINDRWLAASWLTRAVQLAPVRALVDRLVMRRLDRSKADRTLAAPRRTATRARPSTPCSPRSAPRSGSACAAWTRASASTARRAPEDFLSREALIHSLCDIASKNGNLLLNVGPRGEDAADPGAAARAARLARVVHVRAAERRSTGRSRGSAPRARARKAFRCASRRRPGRSTRSCSDARSASR